MAELVRSFRGAIKRIAPRFVINARRRWVLSRSIRRLDQELVGKPTAEIFSEIYRRQLWGRPTSDRKFSSGHGSSMELHVGPYVAAVGEFLASFPARPSVVDLGCGDFNVGSKIRQYFGNYIACDVAHAVLNENRIRYSGMDVEFRQLDMINEPLPDGEVCIIRQVLQHLSNADILRVVQKLYKYQVLIITEPVPRFKFLPNLDQPTGVSSRLARGIPSGVVLTEPPFSLRVAASKELCATLDELSDARLVTTAFSF